MYDRRLTEIRWFSGATNLRVLSNIDFNHLSGLGSFESRDTVYLWILGLGNEESAVFAGGDNAKERVLAEAKLRLPDLTANPMARSSYLIVEGNAAENPAAVAALNALHEHYDANRLRIIGEYQQQQADNTEHARQLREHPPVQKDTVINFWPKKNSIYLNSKE